MAKKKRATQASVLGLMTAFGVPIEISDEVNQEQANEQDDNQEVEEVEDDNENEPTSIRASVAGLMTAMSRPGRNQSLGSLAVREFLMRMPIEQLRELSDNQILEAVKADDKVKAKLADYPIQDSTIAGQARIVKKLRRLTVTRVVTRRQAASAPEMTGKEAFAIVATLAEDGFDCKRFAKLVKELKEQPVDHTTAELIQAFVITDKLAKALNSIFGK